MLSLLTHLKQNFHRISNLFPPMVIVAMAVDSKENRKKV